VTPFITALGDTNPSDATGLLFILAYCFFIQGIFNYGEKDYTLYTVYSIQLCYTPILPNMQWRRVTEKGRGAILVGGAHDYSEGTILEKKRGRGLWAHGRWTERERTLWDSPSCV